MARGFNTTDGSGTTDSIVTTYTAHHTTSTIACSFTRRSNGGGGIGRMFQKGTTGDFRPALFTISASGDKLRYAHPWSTSNGEWHIDAPATSATTRHRLAVRYDGGSTSNDAVFWLNGASQTVTEQAAPSGSLTTHAEAWVIGNRKSDTARCWDGMLWDFAIWSRLLSDDEMTLVTNGHSPLWMPNGLVCYVPMIGTENVDYYNTAPTITGTAIQAHAGVLYPRGWLPGDQEAA